MYHVYAVLIIPATLVCLLFSFSNYFYTCYCLLFNDLRSDLNDVNDDVNMKFVVIG